MGRLGIAALHREEVGTPYEYFVRFDCIIDRKGR